MKHSLRVAYSGIVVAVSLLFLFGATVFPYAEYALPALAGICLVILVIDFGYKNAVVAYVAVSLLAGILVPNKEAVILFIVFLGYYPILKSRLEQIKNHMLEWCAKLAIFNFAVLLSYYLMISVLGMTEVLADFEGFKYGIWVIWLLGNAVFVLYDFALTRLISFYLIRIRPKYFRFKR